MEAWAARDGSACRGLGWLHGTELFWAVAVGAHSPGCTVGSSFPWAKLESAPASSPRGPSLPAPWLCGKGCPVGSPREGLVRRFPNESLGAG